VGSHPSDKIGIYKKGTACRNSIDGNGNGNGNGNGKQASPKTEL
jgi:hypothetical protein